MCIRNAYISGPHASARATVEAVVRVTQPLPGQQEEPPLARAMQQHATVHLVVILDAVMGSTRPNSCGVSSPRPRPYGLAPEASAGDHSAELSCFDFFRECIKHIFDVYVVL